MNGKHQLAALVSTLVVLVFFSLLALALWLVPPRQVEPLRALQQENLATKAKLVKEHDVLENKLALGTLTDPRRLEIEAQRQQKSQEIRDIKAQRNALEERIIELQNSSRATIAVVFGSLFLLVTAFFAWGNLRAVEKNAQAAHDNVKVMRDSYLTDRFTRAVAQLGEAGPDKLSIRLGGIYALEGVAKEAREHHIPVMELLCAFVREEAPARRGGEVTEKVRSDVQAILTVIGRRRLDYDDLEHRFNLAGTSLAGAQLPFARYDRILAPQAHWERMNLIEAYLTDGWFNGIHLQGASLLGAHLEGANLPYARLEGTDLSHARLDEANLFHAYFDEQTLLDQAHLEGADLSDVTGLTAAQLNDRAFWDDTTKFPPYLLDSLTHPQRDYISEFEETADETAPEDEAVEDTPPEKVPPATTPAV